MLEKNNCKEIIEKAIVNNMEYLKRVKGYNRELAVLTNYNLGFSITNIAKALKVSYPTIAKIIKKYML